MIFLEENFEIERTCPRGENKSTNDGLEVEMCLVSPDFIIVHTHTRRAKKLREVLLRDCIP